MKSLFSGDNLPLSHLVLGVSILWLGVKEVAADLADVLCDSAAVLGTLRPILTYGELSADQGSAVEH